MVIEPEEQTPCQCDQDCACGNTADLIHGGVAICGCCLADCPDVHVLEGRTWRSGYTVRLVPWRGGYELHVDGVGVTQCVERVEAEDTVRDFLESLERDDARTASVTVWGTPEQR
ncbi:hypothetical protein [Brachybacterium saurashtrense]|uniref:Ferredoxin n=1 Tax=Brachybacterium saurashtrense TaxID=556288 RepID=A0A345YRS0_9MICO|nr:hypothetical protein [Brachybacterium saurashtrense]AXK46622.1 hypothetical protein DWV08_14050 [Brachybacterium saurashtrense]RRR20750.1 hypothetical protein DXU92_17005 [Brachybacterium saurashtrense]